MDKKKPNNYTGTLTGPTLQRDADSDGIISWGDFIEFEVSTNAPDPFVHVVFTPESTGVNQEGWAGGSSTAYVFGCYGGSGGGWQSGAARGVANLVYPVGVGPKGTKWSDPLDTVEFYVEA